MRELKRVQKYKRLREELKAREMLIAKIVAKVLKEMGVEKLWIIADLEN